MRASGTPGCGGGQSDYENECVLVRTWSDGSRDVTGGCVMGEVRYEGVRVPVPWGVLRGKRDCAAQEVGYASQTIRNSWVL